MPFLAEGRHAASDESAYPTYEDLREPFTEGVNGLYLLSFLLTASLGKAERCFVAGLDDVDGNAASDKWARFWARRVIIHNASRIMAPYIGPSRPERGAVHLAAKRSFPKMPLEYARFANILALEDFERVVFVLSVLEGYSDRECSAFLGASPQDVWDARVRALQHLADFEQNESSKEEVTWK